MMRYTFFIISIIIALSSCQSDSEKIGELSYRIKEDSLLMVEMDKQNEMLEKTLDSANALQKALGLGALSKEEAIVKAQEMDSIFKIQSGVIDELNRKLQTKGSKYNILRKAIAQQKRELKKALDENTRLATELGEAKTTITNLEKENEEIRTDLADKSDRLEDKERTLQDMNQRIAEAQKALERANTDKVSASETFFTLGKDLQNLALKTSGFMNKKKKTQLAQQAYCAYQKAYNLGHRNALYSMNSISAHKKLGKLIKKDKCK